MKQPTRIIILSILCICITSLTIARPHPGEKFHFGENNPFGHLFPSRRSISANGDDLNGQTFDYLVLGGGLAGLTVASRLSEDANVTVAVIEAGPDIYGPDQDSFLIPTANLYKSSVGSQYDWQWKTTQQSGLNGRSVPWPRGKVLGGSSSINGLYMVRASKGEHDAWGRLIGAPELWGWDNMLRAMKKSEKFSPPTQQVQQAVPSLKWDASSHGSDGPIHVGWPAVSYPIIESFLQSSASEGTAISNNPDDGESWGSFLATSSIDQTNWQRSSSRTGYLNGVDQRPNLHVLTSHLVTKILTNTSSSSDLVRATGVEYSPASGAEPVKTVYARREVIVSGGAINSPVLLLQSGIGDAQALTKAGIQPVVDLPGVGHNMQDHLSTSVAFSPAPDQTLPQAQVTGNGQEDSYVNSAIAYVNLKTLFGNYSDTLIANVRANLSTAINSAPVSDAVKQAYNATYSIQVEDVFNSNIGPIEILFALSFGQVLVQVALQHPLSRGSIKITSPDPFQLPQIDAGYLTQDIDKQLLREGFKLARRIGNAAPLSDHVQQELSPGPSVQTDDEWDEWIRNNVGTEYHPSSTCSMLPREQGGVVDKNLLVYGLQNLRVIDASVPPTAVSAHLMTITYGIAEIGAEIIKETYQQEQSSTASNTTTSRPNIPSTGSGSGIATKNNNNNTSSASSIASYSTLTLLGSVLFCLAATLVPLALSH